jgi:hypothetical protein
VSGNASCLKSSGRVGQLLTALHISLGNGASIEAGLVPLAERTAGRHRTETFAAPLAA